MPKRGIKKRVLNKVSTLFSIRAGAKRRLAISGEHKEPDCNPTKETDKNTMHGVMPSLAPVNKPKGIRFSRRAVQRSKYLREKFGVRKTVMGFSPRVGSITEEDESEITLWMLAENAENVIVDSIAWLRNSEDGEEIGMDQESHEKILQMWVENNSFDNLCVNDADVGCDDADADSDDADDRSDDTDDEKDASSDENHDIVENNNDDQDSFSHYDDKMDEAKKIDDDDDDDDNNFTGFDKQLDNYNSSYQQDSCDRIVNSNQQHVSNDFDNSDIDAANDSVRVTLYVNDDDDDISNSHHSDTDCTDHDDDDDHTNDDDDDNFTDDDDDDDIKQCSCCIYSEEKVAKDHDKYDANDDNDDNANDYDEHISQSTSSLPNDDDDEFVMDRTSFQLSNNPAMFTQNKVDKTEERECQKSSEAKKRASSGPFDFHSSAKIKSIDEIATKSVGENNIIHSAKVGFEKHFGNSKYGDNDFKISGGSYFKVEQKNISTSKDGNGHSNNSDTRENNLWNAQQNDDGDSGDDDNCDHDVHDDHGYADINHNTSNASNLEFNDNLKRSKDNLDLQYLNDKKLYVHGNSTTQNVDAKNYTQVSDVDTTEGERETLSKDAVLNTVRGEIDEILSRISQIENDFNFIRKSMNEIRSTDTKNSTMQ